LRAPGFAALFVLAPDIIISGAFFYESACIYTHMYAAHDTVWVCAARIRAWSDAHPIIWGFGPRKGYEMKPNQLIWDMATPDQKNLTFKVGAYFHLPWAIMIAHEGREWLNASIDEIQDRTLSHFFEEHPGCSYPHMRKCITPYGERRGFLYTSPSRQMEIFISYGEMEDLLYVRIRGDREVCIYFRGNGAICAMDYPKSFRFSVQNRRDWEHAWKALFPGLSINYPVPVTEDMNIN